MEPVLIMRTVSSASLDRSGLFSVGVGESKRTLLAQPNEASGGNGSKQANDHSMDNIAMIVRSNRIRRYLGMGLLAIIIQHVG